MDYSKKYRWALTGFIILLILNIGTLATIWLTPRPPFIMQAIGGHGGVDSGGIEIGIGRSRGLSIRAGNFMATQLNLSADQAQKFEKLRREHLKKVRPLLAEIAEQRRSYFSSLGQQDSLLTPEKMDSIAQRIGRAHARIEKANYQHFIEMRDLLGEDQKEQFRKFLHIMTPRIAGPAMPAGPPPGAPSWHKSRDSMNIFYY